MPTYGKSGAEVKCAHCGKSSGLAKIHVFLFTRKGIYTPTTKRGIIKGIMKAIKNWNEGVI